MGAVINDRLRPNTR